jgi:hypothetical protein
MMLLMARRHGGGGVRERRVRSHGDGNGANESACLRRLSYTDARVVDAAALAVSHARAAEDTAVADTGIVSSRSLVLSLLFQEPRSRY